MSSGPLRQLTGVLGLVGLTPTAVLLATGQLEAVDAAIRGVITFVGVVLIGRLLAWGVDQTAHLFERRSGDGGDGSAPAASRGGENRPSSS